jgi:hypothetical protein
MKKWEPFEYAAGYRASGCDPDSGIAHHRRRCGWKTPTRKLLELDRHNVSWPRAGTMTTETWGLPFDTGADIFGCAKL